MPSIRVGTFDTMGRDEEFSMHNKEFIPPNCEKIDI